MYEITWKLDNGRKRRTWAPDWETATETGFMVATVHNVPSVITDLATGNMHYGHILRPTQRVEYGGLPWVVDTLIPGLDMAVLRPYGRAGDMIRVKASRIPR